MDMYEINRRRGPRARKKQENTFKSIPNLSIQEYNDEYYSFTPGCDFNREEESRMYRSLGYIPQQGDNEQYHDYDESYKRRSSSRSRRGRREEREKMLWSKSDDNLDSSYNTFNDRSSSQYWRFDPAASESYQDNYAVKDHHYEPYSLPYSANTLSRTRHVSSRVHVSQQQPPPPPVMVGVVRYRRDTIFSRWQEQTFVLTNKYLKCFSKNSPISPSTKPQLLWKVKLSNIENMDLTTKKGHLTIKLLIHGENGKMLLRSGPDTRHWFNMIMACCNQLAVSKAESNYWDSQPPPPTRSESIQRWLLGRPTAATSGVSQAQSLPYQHFQDCHWVQDHQPTYATSNKTNKKKQKSPPRPKTSMSNKVSSVEKYGGRSKMLKQESQDSGNSSLSTPSSKTRNKAQHQQFLSLVNY